ncbi:MAG: ABC transporter transmembrane domain-containing protein [Pseudomonadota bacterium]
MAADESLKANSAAMGAMYRAVWRATGRRQVLLIALALAVAALAAAPLQFQKEIVNGLVEGGDRAALVVSCLALLGVVLLSGLLKFALGFAQGVVGERVVYLIRERVYDSFVHDTNAGRPGLPSKGTVVAILSAEAEMVGAFAGAAIAGPLLQLGTLASVIAFITTQQPALGLFALAVVLPQAVIVVFTQRRINRRVKARVQALRHASAKLAESDIRRVEQEVLDDFRSMYDTGRRIFFLKLSTKFALSVISAFGVVGILLIGGLLVLDGRTDVGIVVASLSGLTRIERPWRDLIAFFRQASTVRVRYELIVDNLAKRG